MEEDQEMREQQRMEEQQYMDEGQSNTADLEQIVSDEEIQQSQSMFENTQHQVEGNEDIELNDEFLQNQIEEETQLPEISYIDYTPDSDERKLCSEQTQSFDNVDILVDSEAAIVISDISIPEVGRCKKDSVTINHVPIKPVSKIRQYHQRNKQMKLVPDQQPCAPIKRSIKSTAPIPLLSQTSRFVPASVTMTPSLSKNSSTQNHSSSPIRPSSPNNLSSSKPTQNSKLQSNPNRASMINRASTTSRPLTVNLSSTANYPSAAACNSPLTSNPLNFFFNDSRTTASTRKTTNRPKTTNKSSPATNFSARTPRPCLTRQQFDDQVKPKGRNASNITSANVDEHFEAAIEYILKNSTEKPETRNSIFGKYVQATMDLMNGEDADTLEDKILHNIIEIKQHRRMLNNP